MSKKDPSRFFSLQSVAMSKPVGKVLDSKAGKLGVKVGNKVIKGAKAPGKLVKKGVKHLDNYYKEQARLRANRDWQYKMGNPNASDYDLSGPKKK